jgi:hypothetical protein
MTHTAVAIADESQSFAGFAVVSTKQSYFINGMVPVVTMDRLE